MKQSKFVKKVSSDCTFGMFGAIPWPKYKQNPINDKKIEKK